MRRCKTLAWPVMAAVILAVTWPCAAQESSESAPAMALRFAELAQRTLRIENAPSNAAWREAAALLKAARECDPNEPRYARLLADAQIALGDKDGAIETLKALRELHFKRGEEDHVAQIEYIDLVVERLATVDEKLNYLRVLVPHDAISPPVRSAAAWRCAVLLSEKKLMDEAGEMVKKALELNPVNPAALLWQLKQAMANGSAPDRFNAALGLMRANPADPDLIIQIARELAGAGLVKDSITWYHHAGTVWGRARQVAPLEIIIEVASQMFLDDQQQQAAPLLDQIIQHQPENYPALVLRLLMEKSGNNREAAEKLRVQARNALINDVAVVRGKMGVREATTRPVNEGSLPNPDLGNDIDRLKQLDDAALRDAYLQAVGNLAWFELYFSGATGEAERLLGVIRALSNPDDAQSKAFIARMEGWLFYLQGGKVGEATVKLSAAAERDPLAALGLVRIYAMDDKPKARFEAAKLLARHPAGFIGGMIYHDVRDLNVKVIPNEKAPPMQEALAKFPRDWMRVVDAPQQFYLIRGEPLKVSAPYGEPLWIRLTIQNISDHDLTIGDDALIKPGLWFDAQLTGLATRQMSGVAFERITERVVLRPKETISKTVRIDQGALAQLLNQNPIPPIAMSVSVRTNPQIMRDGVISGPGGFTHDLPRRMERAAFPFSEASVGRMAAMTQSGDGQEKLRAMELLITMGVTLIGQKEATAEMRARGGALIDVVGKARTDGDANVRGWAGFLYAFTAPEEQRAPNALRMLQDEAWQPRLLGLAALQGLPKERRDQLTKEVMEKDSMQLVREFAKASLEKPPPKPTTQPAAQ